jgi:hypothetical protein
MGCKESVMSGRFRVMQCTAERLSLTTLHETRGDSGIPFPSQSRPIPYVIEGKHADIEFLTE